jgi:hypothetical protein
VKIFKFGKVDQDSVGIESDNDMYQMKGTSQATAHIVGTLISEYGNRPPNVIMLT